jgi:uncharacterized protein
MICTFNHILKKIVFLFLLIGLSFHISARIAIPAIPNPPRLVNDFGNMLTDQEEKQLETKLFDYEQTSSNEITIITVEELGDWDVSEYALEIGRAWNIGKKDKKNGVIILASKNDRKINISPGYGLSGVLPDITCGRIIRNQIVPNFKGGKYFLGFDAAIGAIILAINNEYSAEPKEAVQLPAGIVLLLFFLVFVIVFLFFYFTRKSHQIYVSRRGYSLDKDDWHSGRGWFGGFGGGSGGGSWGGSGGGGGFGGFGGGGGGFDGGGASGSW